MSWPRRLAVASGALVVVYAVLAVTVLRGYDDIVVRPFAGSPGLVVLPETGQPRYLWRAGERATVAFHVVNDGNVPIRVTGFEPYVHWNVETIADGFPGAFTLLPGQYRDVTATLRMVHCARVDVGAVTGAAGVRVRYRALGWPQNRLLSLDGALRVDFDRALPDPATRPAWCERYARFLEATS